MCVEEEQEARMHACKLQQKQLNKQHEQDLRCVGEEQGACLFYSSLYACKLQQQQQQQQQKAQRK